MPALRNTGHIIVAGAQSVATIDAATTIKNFPLASDQRLSFPWTAPNTFTSQAPIRPYVRYIDGSGKTHGAVSFFWTFFWTVGMWSYFQGQFLPTEGQSANVSTKQWDDEEIAIYHQSILQWPIYGQGLVPNGPGTYRVTLEFTNGVEIT